MALAAITACVKEEPVAVDQSPISFSNAAVDNSVKSIDETYGTVALEKFNVYGTATGNQGTAQVFNGTPVEGEVGDQTWSYEGTQYWMENVDYKFIGVVDATVKTYADLFPTELNVDNSKDALVSNTVIREQDATIDDSAVSLQFSHILSKAKFTFIDAAAADDYTFQVSNIEISGVNVSGTYTISNGEWDDLVPGIVEFGNATNSTNTADADPQDVAAGEGTTSHYAKLIVPGTYDMSISFDVSLSLDGTEISAWEETVSLNDKTLTANYSYNFIAELVPGRPIDFKVTSLQGWVTDGNEVDIL